MSTSTNAITDKIATLEKALKSNITESLKEKLQDKLAKLKDDLKKASKGEEISAKDLADSLLKSRKKFIEMSSKDFDGVIKRLQTKPEYSFLKSYTRSKIIDDIKRKAKPVGWRFKGRNNFKIPSKEQVKNRRTNGVYYENRPDRSDVSQTRQLEHGGEVVKNFNPKDFSLGEIDRTLKSNDILLQWLRKGDSNTPAAKREFVWGGDKWDSKYWNKIKDVRLTMSDYSQISIDRGSENIYFTAIVYEVNGSDEPMELQIYTKDNHQGLKDFANQFIKKMSKGGSTYAKGGDIGFSNSNLYFNGFGKDSNGNSIIKISFPNSRAFSIQTNGNLPKTHKIKMQYSKIEDVPSGELKVIENEVLEYIKEYGNNSQIKKLKVSKYEDGGLMEDNTPVIRYYFEDEEYEYAKGGMVEHGLQIGDKILSKGIRTIEVENSGKKYVVNLQNGTREAK